MYDAQNGLLLSLDLRPPLVGRQDIVGVMLVEQSNGETLVILREVLGPLP